MFEVITVFEKILKGGQTQSELTLVRICPYFDRRKK